MGSLGAISTSGPGCWLGASTRGSGIFSLVSCPPSRPKRLCQKPCLFFCCVVILPPHLLILTAERPPDATKGVTTRRVQKTRIIAIYFSSASSTTRLDGLSHK